MTAERHPTPPPKMPEHLSTDTIATSKDEKIDKQMQDSFPASDPPSFSGGNHIVGAPVARESEAPAPADHAVTTAEQKVKNGTARQPEKY